MAGPGSCVTLERLNSLNLGPNLEFMCNQGITTFVPHLAVDVVCLRPEDLPDRLVETLVRPREEEGVARVVLGLLGLDGVPSLQTGLVVLPLMIT